MPTTPPIDRLQGVSGGLAFKAPCRAATTGNITLNGLQTIDDVALVQDDRVLVKDQDDDSENGIYAADTGDWQRTIDLDSFNDFVTGTQVHVVSGTSNGSKTFVLESLQE